MRTLLTEFRAAYSARRLVTELVVGPAVALAVGAMLGLVWIAFP